MARVPAIQRGHSPDDHREPEGDHGRRVCQGGTIMRRRRSILQTDAFKTNSKSFIDKRPICIILDDVLDTIKDLRRSVALNTVFSMGRHLNMAVIVCTQYPTALPPSFRMNVDLAVIFNTHSFKVRDIVFRDYAHNLPSWKFYGALDYFTRNFQCLCVMPCTQSNDLRDLFFVSKAEDHGPVFDRTIIETGRRKGDRTTSSPFFSVMGKTV